VSWPAGQAQILPWLERFHIDDFGIIGGEPLINPEWREWLLGLRQLMPNAQLRFTTNGLLLHRALDIVDLCEEIGNIVLKVTVHTDDAELTDNLALLQSARAWEPVYEYGINRWRGPRQVRLQINRPDRFIMTYRGTYQDMSPWHSDPAVAFAQCCQQTCPLLYQGRIYKCSTAGLLKDTLMRHDNPNWDQWESYIDPGIGIDDNDSVIQAFVDNFGKPHAQCAQCPSGDNALIPHVSTTTRKNIRIRSD
jgi:hypothetical protein